MAMLKPYLSLLRPQQWIKNIFVFIPLFFAQKYFSGNAILFSLAAFSIFCLASSTVYILNDLLDTPFDRLHPKKRHRPIASGVIAREEGFFLWAIMLLLTLGIAYAFQFSFFVVLLGYFFMAFSYSLFLKQILFLDVIMVALGFVFRVLGGGIAVEVSVSEWMIVLVFLFTLFLTLNKRRQEIKNLARLSLKTRAVLTGYSIDLIDQMNTILVPIVLSSYVIYVFSERPENPYFIATIPLLLYAFFRFLFLLKKTDFGEKSEDFFRDGTLLGIVIIWFLLVMLGLSL